MTTTDVIYIAGIGRSGSTLLARILGTAEGIENLGEFATYWTEEWLYGGDLPCGCGRAMADCPRWGSWIQSGPILAPRLDKVRRNLSLLRSTRATEGVRKEIAEELRARYERAAAETSARMLVDASKRPALARLAAASEALRLHLIHMTRRPESVADSRQKPKDYLRTSSSFRTGLRWTAVNLAVDHIEPWMHSHVHVRYEDLVNKPRAELERIANTLDLDLKPALDGSYIDVGVQHSLAGNPDRLNGTTVHIVPPLEPRLGPLAAMAVALTTQPSRRRYDY